jgi:hypothetical protein
MFRVVCHIPQCARLRASKARSPVQCLRDDSNHIKQGWKRRRNVGGPLEQLPELYALIALGTVQYLVLLRGFCFSLANLGPRSTCQSHNVRYS